LEQVRDVGVCRELTNREIIYEERQPM